MRARSRPRIASRLRSTARFARACWTTTRFCSMRRSSRMRAAASRSRRKAARARARTSRSGCALGDDVTVVNGDKPILRWRNGEAAEAKGAGAPSETPGGEAAETTCDQPVGEFIAYGTPYCGKENWGQNTSVPLRAVCFIERCEPGEPDRLSRLEDDGEIVARIMNQILMPHDPALAVRQLDLLDRLVNSVSFYVLRCTPTPAAFDAAFQMTLCDNGRERIHRCEGSGHED